MPALYPVPAEASIEELLVGLVSAPTQVTRSSAGDPERDATGVFAEYVTDDGELAVLGFADADTVNFVGGAMMGVEAETLTDASTKSLVLDDTLEGFREIVNVFASCLNSEFTPHLRLGNVHSLPGQLSDEVKQMWRQPRARRAYKISVDEHGDGIMILYLG